MTNLRILPKKMLCSTIEKTGKTTFRESWQEFLNVKLEEKGA
jgi:hypothetical protein